MNMGISMDPPKKREITSHRDFPTFGDIVPRLVHLQGFMAGAVRVQKIALFLLHVDHQEVPEKGSPSKSCGGFVGFPKSLPFHLFYPLLRFPRIFVNFSRFWPCLKRWLSKDFMQRLSGRPADREALVFFYCDPKEVGGI